MIKLLIGGSPCTKWSVAQTKDRETQPNSGIGWELFENYKIALDKYKPDYFLYENNKSAAQPIKDEIARQLHVVQPDLFTPDNGVRMTHINSALLSAQHRERFYVTNFGDIYQPQDRGILLCDVLDGVTDRDKGRTVLSSIGRTTTREYFQKSQNTMALEPVYVGEVPGHNGIYRNGKQPSQQNRVYGPNGKSAVVTTYNNCKIAQPVNITKDGKSQTIKAQYQQTSVANICCYSSTYGASGVAEPVPCGQRQQDKSRTITAGYQTCSQRDLRMDIETDGFMGKQGVIEMIPYYATPVEWDEDGRPTKAVSCTEGKVYTVYEVKDGYITIKDKQYPIKLPDGFYIIRKLTVKECMRLQTIPDWYEFPVSDSQAYKMIGNGWTIEVIKYLLSHIPNIQNEEIEVLSMYDGMSCGQIALKEMGCNVVRYYATEIDKYAIQTTQHNFPNTIQLGDAFQVRDSAWRV